MTAAFGGARSARRRPRVHFHGAPRPGNRRGTWGQGSQRRAVAILGALMTLLAELAAVSERVAATTSRLAKVRELAGSLGLLAPDEIPIAISFLSGETRQGKLGASYATLQSAAAS